MSREMAAMAGGVDALARRARDLALADERNLEVALRLASAAADVAAEELRDASLEAETDLDWPESSSSSADFLDARLRVLPRVLRRRVTNRGGGAGDG